jgi:hypothetical protein
MGQKNRRMSAQYTRRLPSWNTSEPGEQGWFSQPQQMLAAPADSAVKRGIRMLQSQRGPQDNPSGQSRRRGSLTAICMLGDDIALFTHDFPDADDRELRAHCLSTLLRGVPKAASAGDTADGDHLGGAGAGGDPGPGRLRGPALDSGGFGEFNACHGAHYGPGRLNECAQPKPGPEGGRCPRPSGQQGNAGRDEGRDGKPLSDTQLERIVRLALGKRVPVALAVTAGGDPPQATTLAVEPAGDHQAELEVASKDECQSHATDCTGPEGSPPARGEVRPLSPELQEAVALRPSGAPTAQPMGGVPSAKAMAAIPGGKRKSRAAKTAARAALEADGGSPAAGGNQAPPARRPQQCPVFGCTREHVPSDCPTFLDMTPKERLDLVHVKRLCLLCLQHPLSVGCKVAGKGSRCPAEGCGRPHHVTLHGILKAGKSSPPEGSTAGGRGSWQDSRDGKAVQRPAGGPGHRSWRLGGSDRGPETRGARAAVRR